ncbi:serine--tRNA ligase [Sphingomonas gilva]|uniref:Serine--tRNA ligase n=1 Tax=Sphingomonas gilva TaxID=2305907 RepID=A0A396S183_9SPHN|nr:serine--tRNA ligase [Sphingomonas gilva]RHW17135.1 serine--tRNA ligase [Sphingomonas gilva]
MHDIRLIRDDPAAFDAALARRGVGPVSSEILTLDEQNRREQTEAQANLSRRNQISKLIGQAMARGDSQEAERLKAEVEVLKYEAVDLSDAGKQLRELLSGIPNIPADEVPDGKDESANVEQKRWGTPRSFDFAPKEHADLGPPLGMDFEAGAAISGARFTVLRGQMARLHRALAQFMLDYQTGERGFTEIAPPLLVREEAMVGTGQLPKFAEDSFKTTDGRWLIPTSEVSLTNLVREQILDGAALPIRYTALTPCFRSEAGSAGRDTRGFIRQHQFEKVELVAITAPEESEAEHLRMVEAAEAILEALELPYRRMLLCTGDMGFGARKTYDLEVWLPGQNAYREISSVSNTGDFQARRMNARYRPEGEKGTRFVHTLNGSGLAVGRTLVAVLENGQQADGSVDLPKALAPWLGGLTKLQSN